MSDSTTSPDESGTASPPSSVPPISSADLQPAAASGRRSGGREEGKATRVSLAQAGGEAPVSLGVRIPRDLDNKLAGLLYRLRLQNIRASKAELVALALEDLPDDPTAALIHRLEKR